MAAAAPIADYGRVPDTHLAEHECDPEGRQRGYIQATDYGLPYMSQWSRLHEDECANVLRCLNCSYLSTPGVPPTLVALKQHAQALCRLILILYPSLEIGEINADNQARNKASAGGAPARESLEQVLKFHEGDAFDFLSDLSTPYTTEDPLHHLPLNSLVNEVAGRSDISGTDYHCPMTELPPRAKGEPAKPYANHHNLIMHANACLERLDHEFSSEGGLMAVLPPDGPEDSKDKQSARNSLLGQWLAFTQHLVRRSHELELSYGNALDVLAGDATVPYAALSSAGLPDARDLGRQIAYPQDKWLLANAGDDVFQYIHKLLDNAEVVALEKEKHWKAQGVSGERHWYANRGGEEASRGIIHVNVRTRYYRLAGTGHGTVFVVPGWDHHPGVEHTRMLERQPKIVGTPMGMFPTRVSELEKKVSEWREELEKEKRGLEGMGKRMMEAEHDVRVYKAELERLVGENEALRRVVDGDVAEELAATEAKLELAMKELEETRRKVCDAEVGLWRAREDERVARDEELRMLRNQNAEFRARLAEVSSDMEAEYE
jgi:hypothetical protein